MFWLAKVNIDIYGSHHAVTDRHQAGFLLLLALLGSFLFIRTSARMIRAQVSWWPGNVQTSSGLHIHHLVWGICTMMITGFLAFALEPGPPWWEILAVFFGIGAGMALDEFALWVHLEDVYWTNEGRSSVDAVIVAATLAGLVLMGLSPLDLTAGSWVLVVANTVINLFFVAIAVLKGKKFLGLIGVFLPFVSIVAALRLAKPNSWWARKRYTPDNWRGATKLERSKKRYSREGRLSDRFITLVGGKPDQPDPDKPDGDRPEGGDAADAESKPKAAATSSSAPSE
jgi:hypothetical protein